MPDKGTVSATDVKTALCKIISDKSIDDDDDIVEDYILKIDDNISTVDTYLSTHYVTV